MRQRMNRARNSCYRRLSLWLVTDDAAKNGLVIETLVDGDSLYHLVSLGF